jgi:polysaccharide pyruvyl transferase WcaK-like protein
MRRKALNGAGFETFLSRVTAFCDQIISTLGVRITLVPMYYAAWETDLIIANAILQRAEHATRITTFRPQHSVEELGAIMSTMGAFVATPMHATLLSTSHLVPTMGLYYEPKGKAFLDRIGQARWAFPLEKLNDEDGAGELLRAVTCLWHSRGAVRMELKHQIPKIRTQTQQGVGDLLNSMKQFSA